MTRSNYALVNPLISGSMNTIFKASDPKSAAKKAYDSLSSNFSNSVPKFLFTLKNDDTLYHWKVSEKVDKDGHINVNIVPFKLEGGSKEEKLTIKKNLEGFHRAIEKISSKQDGGKYDDSDSSSDSSSSSSSSDIFKKASSIIPPISYYWYTPAIYYTTVPDIYIPSLIYIPNTSPSVIKYDITLTGYIK